MKLMNSITHREKEVLALIATGCTQKTIARSLYISEHTFKTHCRNLLVALKAVNAPHMVAKAFQMGLLADLDKTG